MTEPTSQAPPPEPRSARQTKSGRWPFWSLVALPLALIVIGVFGLILLQTLQFMPDVWPKAQTRGQIYVDTPEVYTRERLVNDRFRQQAWLDSQLQRTDDLLKGGSFAGVEGQLAWHETLISRVGAGTGQKKQESKSEQKNGPDMPNHGMKSNRETSPPPPIDEFRDALAYRDEIRAEMMRTQLDDTHDIEGNTLYRLNFDVTITPGDNTRASAKITIEVAEDMRPEESLKHYAGLYADWQKHMQKEIDSAIAAQTADMLESGTLLDGLERAALQEFLEREICRAFRRIVDAVDWRERGPSAAMAGGGVTLEYCEGIKSSVQDGSVHESLRYFQALREYVFSYKQVIKLYNLDLPYLHRLAAAVSSRKQRDIPEPLRRLVDAKTAHKDSSPTHTGGSLTEVQKAVLSYAEERCDEFGGDRSETGGDKSFKVELSNQTELFFPCPRDLRPHEALLGAISMLERVRRLSDFFFSHRKRAIDLGVANPDELISRITCVINPNNGTKSGPNNSKQNPKGCSQLFDVLKNDDPTLGNSMRGLPEIAQPFIRRVIAEFLRAKLNDELRSNHVLRPLGNFFEPRLGGCELEECTLLLGPKINVNMKGSDKRVGRMAYDDDMLKYLQAVLNAGARTFSYAVTPTEMVQRLASEGSVRADLQAALQTAAAASSNTVEIVLSGLRELEHRIEMRYRNPIVVGFGTPDVAGRPMTEFGWIIRPRLIPKREPGYEDYRQMARHYPLTAVISVPSWWKSLKITVHTQWVNTNKLETPKDPAPNGQESTFYIQIPGSVKEIKEKLRYEVRKEPYIDDKATRSHGTQHVEIGRPARIIFEGGRLWRSTVVSMGHQQADKIEVLPDMRGIIAEFKCVKPPPPGSPKENLPVTVWTSEGRTALQLYVSLHAFTPLIHMNNSNETSAGDRNRGDPPCSLNPEHTRHSPPPQ
jgi:hypothetical protein